MEMQRKLGPIDISALDSRKGPAQTRNPAPAMTTAASAKTTSGGFFKPFGGNGGDSESKANNKNLLDPQAREDAELGIDRSAQDPIKFVSAIDSKPIYPPYLQLADFESYLKKDVTGQQSTDEKKKDNGAAGDKEEAAATVTSSKPKKMGNDEVTDYKQEMEDFKETISEMYYEKAVKLMDDVEETRRMEELNKLQT